MFLNENGQLILIHVERANENNQEVDVNDDDEDDEDNINNTLKLVGTLDQKLGAATYQVRWDFPGQLAAGNHTLKLVFKVTSATINRGSLDAVIVR